MLWAGDSKPGADAHAKSHLFTFLRIQSGVYEIKKYLDKLENGEHSSEGNLEALTNMMHQAYPSKPRLSNGEKLKLIFKLLTICRCQKIRLLYQLTNNAVPARLLFHVVRMSLIAVFNRMSLKYTIMSAGVKTVFETLGGREIQVVQPSTRQTYEQWLKKKTKTNKNPAHSQRLVNDIQQLDSGRDSAILWLGDRRKAQKVVLFFHGGGYVIPLSPGHVEWCWNTYVLAGVETGVETAVAILQYTLAPGGKYPVQLQQAVAAYNEVRALGFEPEDIVVGGDSAGGNLTMQLVSHILHPKPGTKSVELERPFAAVFLVSPWLSRDLTSHSFKSNNSRDMISMTVINSVTAEAATPQEGEKCDAGENGWLAALQVAPTWFNNLDTITNNMYIAIGKQEVLADHGRGMAKIVRDNHPNIALVYEEGEKETHDYLVLEGLTGSVGETTIRMRTWFKSILSSS